MDDARRYAAEFLDSLLLDFFGGRFVIRGPPGGTWWTRPVHSAPTATKMRPVPRPSGRG
ncbi:hypothetical protein [Micromonospora sp. DT47]|uniref:hypothetical protein n=1 Tax=Micromonospora sp. DT47 TaxID=3393431 RepID=UPI003CFA1A7F